MRFGMSRKQLCIIIFYKRKLFSDFEDKKQKRGNQKIKKKTQKMPKIQFSEVEFRITNHFCQLTSLALKKLEFQQR